MMTEEYNPRTVCAKFYLGALTDQERLELFYDYCTHCGCKQPEEGQSCQCWNDE